MNKYILALDASQIKLFDGFCSLAWAYSYRENLRKTGLPSEAPDKGTLIHELLEYYYKDRALYPETDIWQSATKAIELFRDTKTWVPMGFNEDLITFLCKRFNQYLVYWSGRDLKPYILNKKAATELGFSKKLYEDENVLFIVEGKIDLINIIDFKENILAICDHKTQDREAHYYNFRPQMLTYAWAARELGIQYGIINYFGLQKEYKDKVTFRRDTMQIPSWMLDRWEEYMLKVFREIAQIEHFNNDAVLNSEFLYEKRLTSCAGAFETHPCMFTELCETKSDSQREHLKNFHYHKVPKWEPWKLKEKMETK